MRSPFAGEEDVFGGAGGFEVEAEAGGEGEDAFEVGAVGVSGGDFDAADLAGGVEEESRLRRRGVGGGGRGGLGGRRRGRGGWRALGGFGHRRIGRRLLRR